MSGTDTRATATKLDFSVVTKDYIVQLAVFRAFSHIMSFDPGNNPTIQADNIVTSVSQVRSLRIGEMWIPAQSFTAIQELQVRDSDSLLGAFSAFILITIKKRCHWLILEPTE